MIKSAKFVLIALLLISVIANVDLYRKQNADKATPAEANGTYELLISNLNGVNLALTSYLTAGNSADKTLAMFQLIRQTDRAYMDVHNLNRQLADVYEGDFLLTGRGRFFFNAGCN